jgi:hypothetical protein
MDAVAAVSARDRSELTPGRALRIAWLSWLSLAAIPFLLFIVVVLTLTANGSRPGNRALAERWFLFSMLYLALAVPCSFFLRSYVFKAYWAGEVVSPKNYLTGMLTIWMTIVAGGILALIGCWLSDSLLPNLLPALVAFMLFIPFWPSGRAMTRRVGNDDDPEHYEEPR